MTNEEKVLAIWQANAEQEKKEILCNIARRLQVEYTDFMDIQDTEMSIDLGENLRNQLSTVFKALQKCGVNLK